MSEEKTVDIESMSSKEALGYFLPKVDEDARKAKKEGRLVCWSASVAPPEFCTAMDILDVCSQILHHYSLTTRKLRQCLYGG